MKLTPRTEIDAQRVSHRMIGGGLVALILTCAGCAGNPPPAREARVAITRPASVPDDWTYDSSKGGYYAPPSVPSRVANPEFAASNEEVQTAQAPRLAAAQHDNGRSWGHDLAMAGMGAVAVEAGRNIFSRAKTGATVAAGGTVAGRLLAAPEVVAPAIPEVAAPAVAGTTAAEAGMVARGASAAPEVVELGEVLLEVGEVAETVCLIVCW